ncbi:hypothetical protein PROSTU_02879 [Providencia stuartii ATCC 25827]|uniref:Uncharacterized protein n=1 Tax=Providencia stuartii ATCC 25827 TaxID=471874 RepID=A0AA87CUJ3_PROST|nr:hypothetical protein PROSTU_02879 [Providencia stuartii ATCC 25827]
MIDVKTIRNNLFLLLHCKYIHYYFICLIEHGSNINAMINTHTNLNLRL